MSEHTQSGTKLQQTFRAIEDYFVHSSLRTDKDKYYRARILIAVMLTFSTLILIAYGIGLATSFLPQPIPMKYGTAICLPAAACFVFLLFLSRRSGYFLFCSVSSVLVILAAVVTGITVTGGPAQTPVLQLIVIPPLAAYFFGGLRWGGYATAISFAALLTLSMLHLIGISFGQCLDDEQLQATRLLVTYLNFCVIAMMAYIYEFSSVALKLERDTEHDKYVVLSKTDALTGLDNRRNFDATLAERIRIYGAQQPAGRFALCYLDLDGFKPINDQYGHAVGDEVLRIVSDRLKHLLRGADLVGRHGGDEFMMLLDSISETAGLENMAQRILSAIAKPIMTTAGTVSVSGSLGVALFPFDASEIEELKRYADTAMYVAKKQHGCWRLYQKGM